MRKFIQIRRDTQTSLFMPHLLRVFKFNLSSLLSCFMSFKQEFDGKVYLLRNEDPS
jgi:hypothetical protein